MAEFHFHPELFEARATLIAVLAQHDILWFSEYPTLDVLHDEYGLEVSGIREKETALQIGWLMVESFPDWHYGALFLKDWGIADRGWKVIIAKRPECEGPGRRAKDGSRTAYMLRDVLRWPRHDPSEDKGEWNDREPIGDEDVESSEPMADAAESPVEERGGAPASEEGASTGDADGPQGDGEPESADDGAALAFPEDAASDYVRLTLDDDDPMDAQRELLYAGASSAEFLDHDGIQATVERSRRPDSGLGAWVGTAWVEFTAIGPEPVHPHREDHREVIELAVRYLAFHLSKVGSVGLWSPTVAVVLLPAARNESAYEASAALEGVLGMLRRMTVVRGESQVQGLRMRVTLGFLQTPEGGDATESAWPLPGVDPA